MATEQFMWADSFIAGGDLSALQYHFVKLGASEGQVVAITADTDVPVGVLQNAPDAAGKSATVVMFGRCKVKASAVIALGALIGPSANGRAVTLAAANPTKYWAGRARSASGGADEIISAWVDCVRPLAALTAN